MSICSLFLLTLPFLVFITALMQLLPLHQTQHLVRRSVTCTPTLPLTRKVWTSNSRRFFVNNNAKWGLWRERKSTVSEQTHTHFSSTQLCSLTHCSVFRYRLFGQATQPLSSCEWSSHFKYAFSSWQASQAHLAWFALLKGKCLIGTCLCLFLLSEEQTWTLPPQRLHVAIWDFFYW